MAYPATPKTWVAGDVLTAAQLNAELRDALLAAFPLSVNAWTAYTPTLTQSGAVTKTVTYAKYQRVGRLITANVLLVITGTGTAGQPVIVGLPVAAALATAFIPCGGMWIRDTSTSIGHAGVAMFDGVTTEVKGLADGNTNFFGAAGFAAALASGDVVGISVTYEAAS